MIKFSEYVQNQKPVEKKFQTLQALQESTQADGAIYFDPKAVQQAYNQNYMSRETVIHLPPSIFLKLAKSISKPDPIKQARVLKALEDGDKFSDLCYLTAETKSGGDLYVNGHEGRHRAMALRDLGVNLIPVVLISSGGSGDWPSYRWGQSDRRPSRIFAEDSDFSIPMPRIETF